jgi:hypothetical protein
MNDITSRLRSAITAVNESNMKLQAADQSIALLTAAIDAVPNLQGEVNALANADTNAFEEWAKAADGSDPPAIDADAHHAATMALVAAQKKGQAAASALTRIEADRMKARNYGEAARSAITPLAAQIVISKRVPELLAEATELQTKVWHLTAQFDDAYALLITFAESLPKGSEEAREVYQLAEKLGNEIRNRRQGHPANVNAIRAAWMQEVNATIDAHANEAITTENA